MRSYAPKNSHYLKFLEKSHPKKCKGHTRTEIENTNLLVASMKLPPGAKESKLSKFPMRGKLVKRGPGGIFLNS